MAKMTGGEIIAKMLQIERVNHVFGIIDGTYFGFYSKLETHGIQLITPRHETSAAHMAGAYARASGGLGVCMASNGPGVANILPGLVVEEAEGNRVLVITSSRRTGLMYPERPGAYQTFDQTGAIGKFAKWSVAVPTVERIPELMRAALRKSFTGRPGVVHVDIPENIINGVFNVDEPFLQPEQYRLHLPMEPAGAAVEEAAAMLMEAKFPVIQAGNGVVHGQAFAPLEHVVDLLHAPITTSWAGRGAVRESHPLMFPMMYIKTVNAVRNAADVVLVLGSRLGETDWWGKAPYWDRRQRVIQVDIDPDILGANKPVALAIRADVGRFLTELSERLQAQAKDIDVEARTRRVQRFIQERERERRKLDEKLQDKETPLHPAHVPAIANEMFPEDAPVVFDGGNSVIWGNFYYHVERPGSVYSTFKFGMLGAGVAQALGVAAAEPDTPVCCIIGDGAMGFHPQEIETAVRNDMKVIYLVMADKQWGMVKMNQHFALKPMKTLIKKSLSPEESIKTDLGDIAFDKLAESMGAYGERVDHPDQLRAALQRALDAKTPAVIHCDVDPVQHMWAPGLRYFKDLHDEPAG